MVSEDKFQISITEFPKAELDQLTLDPENANKHDDAGIEKLSRILSKFGQQIPIVIDGDGKIIKGNGTYLAAMKLGWNEIHYIVTSLDGDQKSGFAIADNKASEFSDFDADRLGEALRQFAASDADMSLLEVGFEDSEVNAILGEGWNDLDESLLDAPGDVDPQTFEETTTVSDRSGSTETPKDALKPASAAEVAKDAEDSAQAASEGESGGVSPKPGYARIDLWVPEPESEKIQQSLDGVAKAIGMDTRGEAVAYLLELFSSPAEEKSDESDPLA